MPRQVTTKTIETHDEDEEDTSAADLRAAPLFDGTDRKKFTKISVKRTDPAEGHLGYLEPDASEQDIFAKWGGGEFIIQARDAGMKILGQRTVKIAGDPVFVSEIEEARWRRQNGLRPRDRGPADNGGSLKDVLTLLEEREAKRREEERERRAEERREQAEREERARREQRDHEEKLAREQAERDERRRRDEAERDERRRQQHREDLDRAQAQAQATLAQTQQFFTQLQAITKEASRSDGNNNPIQLLTAGMELALKLRGDGGGNGEPSDALTALLSRLPETLAEVRSTAKEAYHEIKGKNGAPAAPAALPPVEGGEDDDAVTITGATAKRLKTMIGVLQRAGKDPEEVINGLASHVIGLSKKNGAAQPAAAAARPSSSARPSKASRPSSSARRPPARPSARQPSKASSSSARPSARQPSKASRPSSGRQMKNAST